MSTNKNRKKKPAWPWIAGILVLTIIFFLAIRGFESSTYMTTYEPGIDPEQAMDSQIGPAVDSLLTFVTNERATVHMEEDTTFLSRGIMLLGKALNAVSQNDTVTGVDVEGNMSRLESKADFLRQDIHSLASADTARAAFLLTADWLEKIQEQNYGHLQMEVAQAMQSAEAINANVPLMEQKESIQMFFNRAAWVVRKMAYREQEDPLPL
jgi:hypothetical protein